MWISQALMHKLANYVDETDYQALQTVLTRLFDQYEHAPGSLIYVFCYVEQLFPSNNDNCIQSLEEIVPLLLGCLILADKFYGECLIEGYEEKALLSDYEDIINEKELSRFLLNKKALTTLRDLKKNYFFISQIKVALSFWMNDFIEQDAVCHLYLQLLDYDFQTAIELYPFRPNFKNGEDYRQWRLFNSLIQDKATEKQLNKIYSKMVCNKTVDKYNEAVVTYFKNTIDRNFQQTLIEQIYQYTAYQIVHNKPPGLPILSLEWEDFPEEAKQFLIKSNAESFYLVDSIFEQHSTLSLRAKLKPYILRAHLKEIEKTTWEALQYELYYSPDILNAFLKNLPKELLHEYNAFIKEFDLASEFAFDGELIAAKNSAPTLENPFVEEKVNWESFKGHKIFYDLWSKDRFIFFSNTKSYEKILERRQDEKLSSSV